MMPRETIMIVDDDRSFVEALSIFLEDQGYCTVKAFSGRDGLALLQSRQVNLAIVDLHIPDLSGMEVAKEARRVSPPVPAILISADDGPATREQCRVVGVPLFLAKPLAPDDLLEAIAHTLDTSA